MEEENTKKYRMAALDLDGTLLDENREIAAETVTYLRQLIEERGFTICIATGRAIQLVTPVLQALSLSKPIPVVCANGAEAYMCLVAGEEVFKERLFSTPVPACTTKKILDMSHKLGCVTQYYVGEKIYANPRQDCIWHVQLTSLYEKASGSQTIYVSDGFQKVRKQYGLPTKLLILCRTKDQDKVLEKLQKELQATHIHIVPGSLGWFLELLPPNVNKGNGLQKLCQEFLQIPIHDCIALGDGNNDVEFLQLAGKGIAMANADPLAKDSANEVSDYTNREEGVRKILQQLEAQGSLVLESS